MTLGSTLMLAAAAAFTVISGVNDGSALLTPSLTLPAVRPFVAMATLAVMLVAGPYLIGTEVATTLARRLVSFQGVEARMPLFIALVAAVGVVAVLTRLGLPTSLTLALIGGIAGAGFGYGLAVSWDAVGFVLAVAAAAPIVGGVAGFFLMRLLVHLPANGPASTRLAWMHRLGFILQSLAYSVNDGQKLLAVFVVAIGTTGVVRPRLDILAAIAGLFVLGMLIGVRKVGSTLGTGVMLARPAHLLGSELASSAAVLGSTVLGAPVSMTQAITASLVGTGVSEGYGRVRWRTALNIAIAWVVTLPAAGITAAVLGKAGSVIFR